MKIKVHDKEFIPFISEEKILARVKELAKQISEDYEGKCPMFLGVLNGSFMFASDLFKYVSTPSTISFIKLVSYKGTSSTGNVVTAIGLEEDISDRHIIIVEDIVDTGKTMSSFLPTLRNMHPASIKICTLLQKPEALLQPLDVDYVGFSIENKFVVGYGLDYDALGRNYPNIYQLD